uniref:PGG domain-containing protein n=1 Tax=viral metagenome TaxID=1070528 RepID=A0A6C0C120_9ZZZZ
MAFPSKSSDDISAPSAWPKGVPKGVHSLSRVSSTTLPVILFVLTVLILAVNFALDIQRSAEVRQKCKKKAFRVVVASVVAGISFVACSILLLLGASQDFVGTSILMVFVIFGVSSVASAVLVTSKSLC